MKTLPFQRDEKKSRVTVTCADGDISVIVIVHTAGIARGFGWENVLSPLLRYRCCQSSRTELQVTTLLWTLLWCLIHLSATGPRWTVMMMRTGDSAACFNKVQCGA